MRPWGYLDRVLRQGLVFCQLRDGKSGATGGLFARAELQRIHGQTSCPCHPQRNGWQTTSRVGTPLTVFASDYQGAQPWEKRDTIDP